MDPITEHAVPEGWRTSDGDRGELPGGTGHDVAQRPEAFVLFERGRIEQRVVHDEARVEQRRLEREQEALAQRYSVYAQSTANPVSFEQFAEIVRQAGG